MPAKTKIRRILVPTDFSDASRVAYPMALTQAKALKAEIVLLHAVDLLPTITIEGGMIPSPVPGLEAGARKQMKSEVARLKGIRVHGVIVNGSPADEILRQALRQKCGLIVMSTHGRRGFMAWVLGSVAERVLRGARCPVLVVKP